LKYEYDINFATSTPFCFVFEENTFFKNNFLHFLIFGNLKEKLVEEKIFFSRKKNMVLKEEKYILQKTLSET
jgi:hypothetical protein